MEKVEIISKSELNGKTIVIVKSGLESFEIVANKLTRCTEVTKAQFTTLSDVYEKEVRPKVIKFARTRELEEKYNSPKTMIEHYVKNGYI